MSVPAALWNILAALDHPSGLGDAVERLTCRYRVGVDSGTPAMRDELDRAAYVAARMPATSAAVGAALDATLAAAPAALVNCASVLDLGSGPGSALWAVCDRLSPTTLTALEQDKELMSIGRKLAAQGDEALVKATWVRGDLRALPSLKVHDLVMASYALGELTASEQARVVDAAWALAGQSLLLIEPGTPRGAAALHAARDRLIAAGAHIAAPCTHAGACPLAPGVRDLPADVSNWCHATVRLPRSRIHRVAKHGSLGFEDEPYSYLVATRIPVTVRGARIVAPPCGCKHAPRVAVCGAEGLRVVTVSRRDKDAYRAARHARWGGLWTERNDQPEDG
jgi:ribosomal protein RSM22 (predicted rRNA methylase)